MEKKTSIFERVEKGRKSIPVDSHYDLRLSEIRELIDFAQGGDYNRLYKVIRAAFLYGYQRGTRAAMKK